MLLPHVIWPFPAFPSQLWVLVLVLVLMLALTGFLEVAAWGWTGHKGFLAEWIDQKFLCR
jgi:hypothetical protein